MAQGEKRKAKKKKEISSKNRTNVTRMSNLDNKKRLAQFDKRKAILYVTFSRSTYLIK
jgi:hypothetical protein